MCGILFEKVLGEQLGAKMCEGKVEFSQASVVVLTDLGSDLQHRCLERKVLWCARGFRITTSKDF
jgi:hypothetical protein